MNVKYLLSLTVCVVIQINTVCQADPCSTVDCGPGKTCRLQEVYCFVSPCYPVAVCDSRPVDVSKCGPGSGPVLDINRDEIFCGRGPARRLCPDNTECKIDPADRFAVCCWKEQRPAVSKPGSCPRPKPGYGICIAKCSHDGDCPGRQKCCGSCPRQCTYPVFKSKPGSCPASPPGIGICIARCTHDQDCPGNLKCCGSCPRKCKSPEVKPKPGSCPASPPGFGICIARCTHDQDCPGNLKCCGSCPRECKSPEVKPKPGRCPRYAWFPVCYNHLIPCSTDSNCPANLKCCTSRCGKTCTRPINQYPWWWWWV